ncbi:MAG: hypothetical protein HDT21_05660 [Ruminococcus sp.]|nr:hypothetical protein [Ruminococcus sp.]
MNNTISWLHISDIHFNIQNYDSEVLREKLIDYIKRNIPRINFIVISGDIVYQGGEYTDDVINFINDLITACGLSENEIIIVPGNHDLKRNAVRKSIVKDIQSSSNCQEFEEEHLSALLKGQIDFFDFFKKIKKITGKTEFENDLHFVYSINNIDIVCLNTSISCGQDQEEGHLKIDLKRLHKALKKLDKSKLNIAVGHHALDCFAENDRDKIFHEFEDHNILLYLCGHSHMPAYNVNADGTKEIETLISGTMLEDNYAKSGFIHGTLDVDSGEGTATFYYWDNKNQQWIVDNTIGRKAPNGIMKLSLKSYSNDNEYLQLNYDEFSNFINDFHKKLKEQNSNLSYNENNTPIKIDDKFNKMKCNNALKRQFDRYSPYFSIINQLMSDPYCSRESSLLITDTIVSQYNLEWQKHSSGDVIFEKIINNLMNSYSAFFDIPKDRLSLYFRALTFWCICECDIFDDEK